MLVRRWTFENATVGVSVTLLLNLINDFVPYYGQWTMQVWGCDDMLSYDVFLVIFSKVHMILSGFEADKDRKWGVMESNNCATNYIINSKTDLDAPQIVSQFAEIMARFFMSWNSPI